MSLTKLLPLVGKIMQRRPLLFNSVVYGFFCTSAEFIRQNYNRKPVVIESKQTSKVDTKGPVLLGIQRLCETLDIVDKDNSIQSTDSYNWPQLKRYAIYGCFLAGPILHGWYKWLDSFYNGTSVRIILTKLFADQFLLTPPLLVVFFTSMSLMEAKSDIFEECRIKFLHTFQTSCGYWLPVQLINFMLVPPSLRVVYVSVAVFIWINILCYLKSAPVVEHANKT
ncbi:mpv17-like protein isoform X2 [Pseudomyrmex gracilis]|uniref:mpv17-like protein isoform X2 n=1 Tax=Pseudomyrmex gracilis TaxID=219809 RepID=UPI000994B6DD|nr:mpv17-like protein isoform X2 [Pseudomyrmex gracilis]